MDLTSNCKGFVHVNIKNEKLQDAHLKLNDWVHFWLRGWCTQEQPKGVGKLRGPPSWTEMDTPKLQIMNTTSFFFFWNVHQLDILGRCYNLTNNYNSIDIFYSHLFIKNINVPILSQKITEFMHILYFFSYFHFLSLCYFSFFVFYLNIT